MRSFISRGIVSCGSGCIGKSLLEGRCGNKVLPTHGCQASRVVASSPDAFLSTMDALAPVMPVWVIMSLPFMEAEDAG